MGENFDAEGRPIYNNEPPSSRAFWSRGKIVAVSVFLGLIVVFIVGMSWGCAGNTAVGATDKYTLVYEGGPLDGRNFIKQLPPGTGRFWKGNLNTVYKYPATERTYIISKRANEGDVKQSDSIDVKAKDGNKLSIQLSVQFHLVPENLRTFHEKFGMKYGAWTEEGWTQLLEEQIRQPIKGAFQRESVKYTAIQAVSDTGKMQIADSVGAVIQKEIDDFMGGHFFQILSLQLSDIDPDPSVQAAIEQVASSQQNILAANNRYLAAQKDAEANRVLKDSLKGEGGYNAVLQKAVESGKVTFWILEGQANITVPSTGGN